MGWWDSIRYQGPESEPNEDTTIHSIETLRTFHAPNPSRSHSSSRQDYRTLAPPTALCFSTRSSASPTALFSRNTACVMWGCEGEEVERGVYVPYTTGMSGGMQKGTEVKEFTHLQRSDAHRDCSASTSALRIRVMRTEPSKESKQRDDDERLLCTIHSHQAARPKQYGELRGGGALE